MNENVNENKNVTSKPIIFIDYDLSLSDIKENENYISILNLSFKFYNY